MKIIICIEDRNGISFDNKRLSKDAVLTNRIIELCNQKKLFLNEYSSSLFSGFSNIEICENPLEKAEVDDFVFVENLEIDGYLDKINELFIFKWNRKYPYDKKLDIDLNSFDEIYSKNFKGYSHKKITEILMRKKF